MAGFVWHCVGTVYIAPSANTYRARIGTVVRNGDASHTIRQFSLLLGRGVAVALGLGAGGAVGGARHVTTKLLLEITTLLFRPHSRVRLDRRRRRRCLGTTRRQAHALHQLVQFSSEALFVDFPAPTRSRNHAHGRFVKASGSAVCNCAMEADLLPSRQDWLARLLSLQRLARRSRLRFVA